MTLLLIAVVLVLLLGFALYRSLKTASQQKARIRELLEERAQTEARLVELGAYLKRSNERKKKLEDEEAQTGTLSGDDLLDRANTVFGVPESSPGEPPPADR